MDTDSFPVIRQPGRRFEVALPGQPVPNGPVVGAILFENDVFEAFYYPLTPGKRSLGNCVTLADALRLFYRRQPVPPRPPSPRFDRFIRRR